MMRSEPYISFIVTARNDDHGGSLLRRMQIFVTSLLEQAEKHNLDCELILVEWNPPTERPRLSEALSWPVDKGPCRVRIIEVPPKIHRRFRYSDALPLFQMIAKNVGIRRALGQFVLATNVDILFSDELMSFLASQSLNHGFVYRIDRYDVLNDIPIDMTIWKQLDYCRDNVIRVYRRDGTFRKDELSRIWFKKIRKGLEYLYWFFRSFLPHWPDPRATPSTRRFLRVLLRSAGNFLASRVILVVKGAKAMRDWMFPPYPQLHTNASGDFTLMAREHWQALRGYPELEMYPLHLDSVLCQMAHQLGLRERVLRDPMRIYHIEHSFGWTPEGQRKVKQSLNARGVPLLEFSEYRLWAIQMEKKRSPMIVNSKTWGLGLDQLSERTI